MKVTNNSTFPKNVSGTRLESGETKEIPKTPKEDLPRRVEVVEKSGETGSDQNTKTDSKSESENQDSNQGGEE